MGDELLGTVPADQSSVAAHAVTPAGGHRQPVDLWGALPGRARLATYALSKSAVSRLSESLQAELVGTGVRVVAVEPGFFATDIYNDEKRPVIDDSSPYADMVHRVDETIAAGIRNGADPAIVAECIVAAANDESTPTRSSSGPTPLPPTTRSGEPSSPNGKPSSPPPSRTTRSIHTATTAP